MHQSAFLQRPKERNVNTLTAIPFVDRTQRLPVFTLESEHTLLNLSAILFAYSPEMNTASFQAIELISAIMLAHIGTQQAKRVEMLPAHILYKELATPAARLYQKIEQRLDDAVLFFRIRPSMQTRHEESRAILDRLKKHSSPLDNTERIRLNALKLLSAYIAKGPQHHD